MRTPLFVLSCDASVSEGEIEQLCDALRSELDVHRQRGRGVSDQWHLIVAIARDVGAVAGAVAALVTVADKVAKWRSEVLAKRSQAEMRLRAPNSEELNLVHVSDEELRAWVIKLEREKNDKDG